MSREDSPARDVRGGCQLRFTVTPCATSTEIVGLDDWRGAIQVRVAAQARGGQANGELISFLSERLSVPSSDIVVVRGSKSRRKTLFVPLTADRAISLLGLT